MAQTAVHTEMPVEHATHEPSFFSADITMLILTWVTFFLLLALLYKYAWKPILAALDQREESIKKAIDDVDRIKAEMENFQATREKLLKEAEDKSQNIVDQARKAAQEAARHIQNKSREEAQILLENARREIKDESEKARSDLRAESVRVAVELAAKILEEKLDDEKDRHLINRLIKEV